MKLKVYGCIKNGKLGLSDSEKQSYLNVVQSLEGKPFVLTLGSPDRVKTTQQLRYLYGVVFKTIIDHLKTLDIKVSKEDLHSVYANEWLTKDITIGSHVHKITTRLSTASVEEVKEYIDTILKHVAQPTLSTKYPDGHKFGLSLNIPSPE